MKEQQKQQTSYQLVERETGEINWAELQPHFARGSVIQISKDHDLISVALEFVKDNTVVVEEMLAAGIITQVSDSTAKQWVLSNPLMKTVVIAPWVLIQEISIT